jgi:hypothetical protein
LRLETAVVNHQSRLAPRRRRAARIDLDREIHLPPVSLPSAAAARDCSSGVNAVAVRQLALTEPWLASRSKWKTSAIDERFASRPFSPPCQERLDAAGHASIGAELFKEDFFAREETRGIEKEAIGASALLAGCRRVPREMRPRGLAPPLWGARQQGPRVARGQLPVPHESPWSACGQSSSARRLRGPQLLLFLSVS